MPGDSVGDAAPTTRLTARDLVAQLSHPLRAFMATEAAGALVMVLATVAALVWANSGWAASYQATWQQPLAIRIGEKELTTTLGHAVDDGLLAVFFFVVGLEVRHELSLGELTSRRRLALPLLAGVAGMALPAASYLLLVPPGDTRGAWGIVIGTDTAFLLGALALVGPRVSTQLRVFLLTVTVIDDIVAVAVIGLVYSGPLDLPVLLVAALLALALAGLSRLRVWRSGPHVLLAIALWCAIVLAGVHGSFAGMVAGLLVADRSPRRDVVETTASTFRAFRQSPMVQVGRLVRQGVSQSLSVNERLQAALHPWTSLVIVPVFALANAGVDLRHGALGDALGSRLTWVVVVSLVLGKLVGIGAVTLAGLRRRPDLLPYGVGPGHVVGGAALSGIGFTVALLVAGLAVPEGPARAQVTVGVLLSAVVSTLVGKLVFSVAAARGEGDADLPHRLDRPVEVGVDHIRGPVDAPLTLVEYGDFECPFCAKATGVAADLRARYGDRLRYVFRHLPLTAVHPHAELAARAALAADEQGRFWPMHDVLFGHQDQLEYEDLLGYAADLDLDVERFARVLEDPAVSDRIRADVASAEASGARGTPTFFIGDRRHVGPYDAETLSRALDSRYRGPGQQTPTDR